MKKTVIALLTAVVLSACKSVPPPEAEFAPEDGIKTTAVKMRTGDVLTILLNENQTTGYSWNAVYNHQVSVVALTHVGAESGLCGAPGRCEARIAALKPGETTVILNYSRPWEENVKPAAAVTYRLEITD
ncbi:MAG: protease inhibitor I42 family protein [Victivallaceae bacterium]|nr:protease inhibitor I42 family protein [Victivallaceae bacterium]